MKETISKYISKRSNDPRENAMLPQQMGADDMFDGALVELRSYDGSVKLILLQVWRKNWKFEEDSSQKRGVCCSGAQYGRGGQTAMAMALSNEKEIKGFDCKAILELWLH